MRRLRLQSSLALVATLAATSPIAGQSTLERTPNLDGAWTGTPGSAYVLVPTRFTDTRADDLVAVSTFDVAFALPHALLLGVRFAPESGFGADEWEPYARWTPLHEADGFVELGGTVAYNSASESVDGALGLARWLGPVRLLAEGRVLSDTPLDDGTELAAGAGAVLHLLSGRVPVALTGDWATLFDRPEGVDAAWSAGIQIGIPFTTHTLSLHATNAVTTTLAGRSFGLEGETFYGLELTIPLGIGAIFGMYAPREDAVAGVHPIEADAAAGHAGHEQRAEPAGHAGHEMQGGAMPSGPVAARAEITRYAFAPQVIEIPVGGIVEWTNDDDVVHTVNAEDHAWHSGAIQPGASWRAHFARPGRYPYFCGPHPFMKGIVVVR